MKPLSPKDRWRIAIHEASHTVFEHHLGLGTSDSATIIPAGEYLGAVSTRSGGLAHYSKPIARKWLVMLAAGRAAENVLTGTRRCTDGKDFMDSLALCVRWNLDHRELALATKRATELCTTTLWEHIGAFATVLNETSFMDRDMIYAMLAGVPVGLDGRAA
ncbi:MAG: hypothetical protein IPL39_15040 [Opitutaceae bacterium]|nr:hypothetical protein [Opitutaceae bacterium]